MIDWTSTCTTATTGPAKPFTLEDLLRAKRLMEETLRDPPPARAPIGRSLFRPAAALFGIPVFAAPPGACEREVPVRRHKKRRHQTEAYHLRVQKKWTKRWGTKTERFILMMNPGAAGVGPDGHVVIADPHGMAVLRNLAR